MILHQSQNSKLLLNLCDLPVDKNYNEPLFHSHRSFCSLLLFSFHQVSSGFRRGIAWSSVMSQVTSWAARGSEKVWTAGVVFVLWWSSTNAAVVAVEGGNVALDLPVMTCSSLSCSVFVHCCTMASFCERIPSENFYLELLEGGEPKQDLMDDKHCFDTVFKKGHQ